MHGVGVGSSHAFLQTSFTWVAPTNSVAPVISGTPTQGLTLTLSSTGTWSNSPISFTEQWFYNTVNSTSGGTLLTGETGLTYIEGSLVAGNYVYCQVKAINPAAPSGVAVFSNIIGPVAASGGLATPTLTNFSALGASPLVLQGSTTDYVAGYRGQLQIATDNLFASITQNIIFFIDGASWASNSVSTGLVTPSGTYYSRWRTVRDNENGTTITGNDPLGNALTFGADVSAWSNAFTDTISSSVAALNTVNGVNKNTGAGVSGTPALTYTGAANGAFQPVRATIQQASNYAQFEFTVTAVDGNGQIAIGYDDGTPTFVSFIASGVNNSSGIGLLFNNASDISVFWNNSANAFTFISGLGGANSSYIPAVGDVYTFVLNKTAGTLELYRTRSGTTIQVGSTATGLPTLTSYFAFIASKNLGAGTLNFGASAFSRALTTDTYYG